MDQLTQQIAGAYIGAQVHVRIAHPEIEGHPEYTGEIVAPYIGTIMYKSGSVLGEVPYDQCRLILTPLSAISDEDAVEVAKMALLSARYCWERWGSNSSLLSVGKEIANDLFEDYGDSVFVAPKYLSNIIVYLRSDKRSDGTPKPVYDLGYMGIRSLIDAGIAISSLDKTETK